MIVTMGETVPGREIVEILDTVKGNTVRTRFFGRDLSISLRAWVISSALSSRSLIHFSLWSWSKPCLQTGQSSFSS